MTDLETAAPRRASRLMLYGPFIALAMVLAAWSVGWWQLKSQAVRGLEGLARRQAGAGGAFSWRTVAVGGYPFRLDVDLTDAAWREPTGWALAAPSLKAEASVFAPGHWVAFAPDGATLGRPTGGAVRIAAKALRASLSDLGRTPSTFSLEGVGLTFTAASGAAPYFLTSAAELHVHTRAGPSDQGAAYVELDRAAPAAGGALALLSTGKPVSLIAQAEWSHAGAFTGPSWAGAVGQWANAGGQMDVTRLHLAAGQASLDAAGRLGADADGRLTGALDARLRRGAQALTALGQAGVVDPGAARMAGAVLAATGERASLTFQAGRTTLGPVALAASPKVY